jgi:hypothetical protein
MTTICSTLGLTACLNTFEGYLGRKVSWSAARNELANQAYFLKARSTIEKTLISLPVVAAAGMSVEAVRQQLENQGVCDFELPEAVDGVLLAARLENDVPWYHSAQEVTYKGLPYFLHHQGQGTEVQMTKHGSMLTIRGTGGQRVHLLPWNKKYPHDLEIYHVACEAAETMTGYAEAKYTMAPMVKALDIRQDIDWIRQMTTSEGWSVDWAKVTGFLTMDHVGTSDRVDTSAHVSIGMTATRIIKEFVIEGPFIRFITKPYSGPYGIWHVTEDHFANPNK